MAAVGDGGRVDAVWGEEGEDVALAPLEVLAQAGTELGSSGFDGGVCVVAIGEWAAVDDWVVGSVMS